MEHSNPEILKDSGGELGLITGDSDTQVHTHTRAQERNVALLCHLALLYKMYEDRVCVWAGGGDTFLCKG